MAKIEIDVAEDGTIADVPPQVQKLIDKAYGKARAEATDEAARNMKGEIEKLKKAGDLTPADRERLKTLEVDLSKAREDLALRDKNFEEAQKIRDERHQKEIDARETRLTESKTELDKRTALLRKSAVKDALVIAAGEGARKESLPELEVLLGSRIGLDDGLQAFVTDAKDPGKPALDKDGKTPVTLEGFVKQYLADHPHHKAATAGRGGGARSGRSLSDTGTSGGDDVRGALTQFAEVPNERNADLAISKIIEQAKKAS